MPSRSCSAIAAPRLPDRSRVTIRAPHTHRITRFACPTPSRKPHPLWGGLTARIMCGCGRARRARLRGLRGYVVSAARRQGTARRCAARATVCISALRFYASARRACVHARRADLPSRAGGCAPLGLPAHGHPRPAICDASWLRGLAELRPSARRAWVGSGTPRVSKRVYSQGNVVSVIKPKTFMISFAV